MINFNSFSVTNSVTPAKKQHKISFAAEPQSTEEQNYLPGEHNYYNPLLVNSRLVKLNKVQAPPSNREEDPPIEVSLLTDAQVIEKAEELNLPNPKNATRGDIFEAISNNALIKIATTFNMPEPEKATISDIFEYVNKKLTSIRAEVAGQDPNTSVPDLFHFINVEGIKNKAKILNLKDPEKATIGDLFTLLNREGFERMTADANLTNDEKAVLCDLFSIPKEIITYKQQDLVIPLVQSSSSSLNKPFEISNSSKNADSELIYNWDSTENNVEP